MDLDSLLPEAQDTQASLFSQGLSNSLTQSQDDKWNAYKDEIHKVYITQNNTLEATMQIIEEQGGPKASMRTWKSKLKEWTYEKNLTSENMGIIVAKKKKRKHEDGKETVFYHWDSEISSEKIERFRKTPKASEIVSPSAETPPNVRYHTPRPECQTEPLDQGDWHSRSSITLDFLPCAEPHILSADHPTSESATNDIPFSELDTMIITDNRITETFTLDLQAINVNRQQDLHFMPDKGAPSSSRLFLQSISNRGSSPQYFSEVWSYDFDEAHSGNNLNHVSLDASMIGRLDDFHLRGFFDEEYQVSWSITAGAGSPMAICNIPWFRFQQRLTATGSLGYNPRLDQVFHSSMPNFDMHLNSLDLGHGAVELNERFRLLCGLFRSPPGLMDKNFLPKFSSKLKELMPESFDGEIQSKLQLLFHPSNNSPLQALSEFALYFLSNNLLNAKQTDEFLEWVTEKRPKELFRLLFAMKVPTMGSFSERILESAARTGNDSVLRFFIDCGLDKYYITGINGGRYLQVTLYHTTRIGVANFLLDNGADVNPPLGEDLYNHPPLFLAALEGHVEIITRLLEAGAKVDIKVGDDTALTYAVTGGSNHIVRELVQAGADVDDGNIDGHTILDWAYLHQKGIYRMLLSKSRKAKDSLTMSGVLGAASRGKQALRQYIDRKSGESLMRRQRVLENALWSAIAEKEDDNTISALLDFGVDPNTETVNTSQPPLVLAAMNYNIDLAERLLNAGADIDSSDVLAKVCWDEDGFDTLNFLIEQGADIEASGGKALRQALYSHSLGAFKLLLGLGANINDQNSYADGYSLLARAARFSEIKTVKYLIKKGAMVNEPPSIIAKITPLQAGAAAGKLEVVKFLLDIGADVNAKPSSRNGMTALEASLNVYELKEENAAIFRLLLDKGADIDGPKKQRRCKEWNSALVALITKGADSELIQLALNAGADVNRRGQGRGARTPLQAAAEFGNLELVKQLLEKGTKINARPSANYGRTALQAACSSENPNLEVVRYLLKEGAEINAAACIKQGLTALQGAAIRGHLKIAVMLLEAGAEVNAEPAEIEGRMALDGAAEHGRLDMVQLLLNFGAKSEVVGNTGFDNAIKLARKNGHFAVAELLEGQLNS